MARLTELERVFMERDGMTVDEAREYRQEMIERVMEGEDPEEILYEDGLEPDYVFDILPGPEFLI